jgi:hypothetical protein
VIEQGGQFGEIINTYRKHNWTLRRVLLRPESLILLGDAAPEIFGDAPVEEAEVDALWFARPSHQGREAWELRLVADAPYALFETFEPDELEEEREELRREMEARMRDYARRA